MKKKISGMKRVGILSVCMAMAMGFTVLAAQVSSISIRVKDNYTPGAISEPTITSTYTLEDLSWDHEPDTWKPGKKVELTLTLSTGDKTFADSYSRTACKIDGADFISAKADDENTLIVRARYVPVLLLGETERAAWSDSNMTKAVWKKVEYATAYDVRLYEDGSLKKTLTVTGNTVDLTEYMKSGRSYYYEVRATGKTTAESKYLKTGEYVQSEDAVEPELGDTSGRWSNSTAGSKYRDENGSYVTNSWKMIFGKWYYFNGEGFALTGWQFISNKWYYLDQDGSMKNGWVLVNGNWYYLDDSGAMVTGWLQTQPGTWYYCDSNGVMLSNTMVGEYKLNADGVWVR